MVEEASLNLKQAAAILGVHYMTAYRYVRTGRLPARRVGSGWVLRADDVKDFVPTLAATTDLAAGRGVDWRDRLRKTLVAGDEIAGWRILEAALAAGHPPSYCYLDLLVGAIHDISSGTTRPRAPIAEEYLATATAARLVARLGARFRRPGRNRGTVVFGAPLGEHHTLPIAVVADLVRLQGFHCLELGADVPSQAFAGAAAGAYRLVAVGVGVTTTTNLESVRDTIAAVRAVDRSIPIVLGGQAATDPQVASSLGADAIATDGLQAVQVLTDLARTRRRLWSVSGQDPATDEESTA